MPELPEIASRAKEIKQLLVGKKIQNVEILQPKCLNIPPEEFGTNLINSSILDSTYRGKWIQIKTTSAWLLINLGMGGDLLLTDRNHLPEKYRLIFDFSDGSCLTINFWWFGYVHFCTNEGILKHQMTSRLGPNVLDLSESEFKIILSHKKGRLKAFLLDQSNVAGIGNAYIHDILYFAKLHPSRIIQTLDDNDIVRLYQGIQQGLIPSLEKGGAFYEKDLHGVKGKFTMEDILIGYREGTPCPVCQTPIQKIKTGSTSSFICPSCQPGL
jgi:formamidopyrimidine-DNA glycosylase